MATLQIAIDAPVCTKKEFLRRTGMSSSSFDRLKALGLIPIVEKISSKGLVLVNMVKYNQQLAEQEV
ncbi:TPA: hypothetical protein NKQ43_002563 [Vibrio parahaemolyticus]|uniref:hypothetical protein n=1 Tax=Vibrio harveyi group TaxID=717610 RepID=UPI0007A0660D|nr:hypothetical protein [Vibrio parahaemolyticus]CAH1546659.1 conserved hypothetical protein [Vibrio jasicida]EGQ8451996.1 hypothetical protein [Vibrio parahaemolyticus]KYY56118.1 hypothetical protein AWQ14_20870 [Vibrio parahaemolyticus]MCX8934520.1 hypothetical protein [Vibrio parahaemolyticus]OKY50112.1 hypothetical protein BUL36_11840 [Vibrio parahaemolyticus]